MDKYKLEYEMKSRGITIEKLCADIHMSRSSFYRKCNGLSQFTQGEIQSIVDYIGLDSPMGIFLLKKCRKRHKKEGGGEKDRSNNNYYTGCVLDLDNTTLSLMKDSCTC